MSRIKDLQKQVHRVLKKMEDEGKRLKAISHLHGVALTAAVLAKKRGENAELATMAGLLHDLYAYKSGSYDDHAHLGAGLREPPAEIHADAARPQHQHSHLNLPSR